MSRQHEDDDEEREDDMHTDSSDDEQDDMDTDANDDEEDGDTSDDEEDDIDTDANNDEEDGDASNDDEAAEAAVVDGGADGAAAAGASEEQEVEQLAEAVARSEAEAIQHDQKLMEEALLRSIVGLAAVAPAVGVVVLKYNHCKSWLRDALLSGAVLLEERDALKAAGLGPTLRSGAKIFVPPGVYAAVAEFFDEGWDLKCSHVVVSAELESKVRSAVEAAHKAAPRSERGSCKITEHKAIDVSENKAASDASVEPSEGTFEYQVIRTFVQIPIPSSMRSASSFQPWSV